MTSSSLKRSLLLLLFLLLGLTACLPDLVPAATATLTPTLTPTVTPIPLAVTINGEGITQEEFDAELARYLHAQAELGITVSQEEATQVVLDDFIDQTLLAQNAVLSGYIVDEAALQARIDALAAQVGGAEALAAWQADNGYTEAGFRSALRRQIAAAWTRDQIIASVPTSAEQVHVMQILFYNADDAQTVYALLQSGWDFNAVAEQYDPLTKGELGWFPRGYLDHPSIEEAAFALQPGEYSAVVESSVGFHILYLVERDPARPLSPDALLTIQESALQDWLTQQRNESTIVIAP
jgi:parvulin-like peptidyl-prolyl isomerase